MNVTNVLNHAHKVNDGAIAFKKLKAGEKRVAIAKDALAQLILGRFFAARGEYVRVCSADGTRLKSDTVVDPYLPNCEVCALGSLLVSKSRIANERCEGTAGGIAGGSVHAGLEPFFRMSALNHIEECFEGWSGEGNPEIASFSEPENAMFAILTNIIDNNGDFRPKQFTTCAAASKAERKIEDRLFRARIAAEDAGLDT